MINIFRGRVILILLGIYQILAGILGLYVGFQQPFLYMISHIFYFVIIIGLFVFSWISGIYLLKKDFLRGIQLSKINQALQMVQFKVLGFGFQYIAGSYVGLGFSDTPAMHIVLKSSVFQSSCFINFNTENTEISVVFNIIAFLLYLIVVRIEKYAGTGK